MRVKPLFEKYQPELVKLVNRSDGRKLLGIDKEVNPRDWIVKLTPNSYHTQVGRNKFKGVFRCYPLFAKKLHGVFSKVAITRNEKLYRNLEKYQGLLHYSGLFEQPRLFPQIFLASGDPIYAGAGDGRSWKGDSDNWNTTHDAAAGEAAQDAVDEANVYVSFATNYILQRMFYPVDTSGIGAGQSVTDADLQLYLTTIDSVATRSLAIVKTFQAAYNALVVGDYEDCGYDTGNETGGRAQYTPVEGATRILYNAVSSGAYNTFALNTSGKAWVDVESTTPLGVREGEMDCDDTAPADHKQITVYFSEYADTDHDPKLEVYYAVAPTGPSMAGYKSLLGVGQG